MSNTNDLVTIDENGRIVVNDLTLDLMTELTLEEMEAVNGGLAESEMNWNVCHINFFKCKKNDQDLNQDVII